MKTTEIPKGLTEYVFSLYLWQKVFCHDDFKSVYTLEPIVMTPEYLTEDYYKPYRNGISGHYAMLRPLSTITDEEAVEVQSLLGWNAMLNNIGNANAARRWIEDIETGYNEFNRRDFIITISVYQYLQQQGFALPVFFQGTQYTVEQLTEMGIIKLKQ